MIDLCHRNPAAADYFKASFTVGNLGLLLVITVWDFFNCLCYCCNYISTEGKQVFSSLLNYLMTV